VTIFAIDTSADLASIAIRSSGCTLSEVTLPTQEGHGHIIFPAIQNMLLVTGVALQQVDCFAAAHGPGSFTGVRVGLAIAKGLAETCGKPAVGISTLRALASFGSKPLRSPMIDARRGEVYAAVYDDKLRLLDSEEATAFKRWTESLGPEIELISEMPPNGLAGAIALCAELDGPELWVNPAGLDAQYIRRDDANSFWREP